MKHLKAVSTNPSDPVWTKTLSMTDAQRQDGNPTGDLRLVQAGYDIDQKTYFREVVFGALAWTPDANGHEQATATFDVRILGMDLGPADLTISYRPEGHADQGNYTTGLRWGDLLGTLRTRLDVTGRELRLYRNRAGGGATFAIEIG